MPPPNNPPFTLTSATREIALIESLSNSSEMRIVIFIPLSCNCLSFGSACLTINSPAWGTAIITSSLQCSTISIIFETMFIAPEINQISGFSLVPVFS